MPSDIKYYQDLGGEKVVFEKEEVASMKAVASQGESAARPTLTVAMCVPPKSTWVYLLCSNLPPLLCNYYMHM